MNATPAYAGHVQEFDGGVAAEKCACGSTAYAVNIDHATGAVDVPCTKCGQPWPLISYEQTDTPRLKALYYQHVARTNDPGEREREKERSSEAMSKILDALDGRGLK